MTLSYAPDVIATPTDGGLVLLNERTGRYWQVNGTAADVLRHLLDGRSVDEAVAALCRQHPRDTGRLTADVESFLQAMRDVRLVI